MITGTVPAVKMKAVRLGVRGSCHCLCAVLRTDHSEQALLVVSARSPKQS
jgi:hypothetical protein